MSDLIARLEKATGPDRELFEACYDEIFGTVKSPTQSLGDYLYKRDRFYRLLDARAWTDAALMLVPEDWFVHLSTGGRRPDGQRTKARADLAEPIETKFGSGIGVRVQTEGTTPALAICIAAMKARGGRK